MSLGNAGLGRAGMEDSRMTMQPVASRSTTGPNPTGGGAQRQPLPGNQPGLFKFVPVTSQRKSKYLNVLAYGQAGMGKTTLAGSAVDVPETLYSSGFCPEDSESSDVLFVSAEGGDIVFENNDRINHPERIDIMFASRIEQVQKVYEWLATHITMRDKNDEAQLRKLQNIAFFGLENKDIDEAAAEQMGLELLGKEGMGRLRRYRTVVIDSLTDVEAANMNHIMGIADKGFDIGDDIQVAGYGEFRKNNNTIQQLVRAFRNLSINLIVICGQKYQQDEMKRFHYGPWLTGQLATQVQSFVDIVGYMVDSVHPSDQTKEIKKLYVRTVPQVKFDAKCRIAAFKKHSFDDPMFIDLLVECGYLPRPK